MSRLVIQKPLERGANLHAQTKSPDTLEKYLERLVSYIPVEILGAYVVFNNVLVSIGPAKASTATVVVLYAVLLLLNAGYMVKFGGEVRNKNVQVLISCAAFTVWSYAIGGATWEHFQTLTAFELRGALLTTMIPILASLAFGLYSPDGFSLTPHLAKRKAGAAT